MYKIGLNRKRRLISKFIASSYNFCLVSQESKGNQSLKFGQLIEYHVRNIFLEKSYTKCGGETILRTFYNIFYLPEYLWNNCLKFCTVCFYCMPSFGLSKLLKLSCKPLAFTSCKAFLKSKKSSGTSLPASISA